MNKVAIIGAGEIGKALAFAIGKRARVEMWDKDPKKVRGAKRPLEEAVRSARVVFICVPSWVVREVAEQISALVDRRVIIVSLAKGIEQGSLKTLDVVLRESFPKGQPVALLGGPLLAEELMADMHGVGVLASKSRSVFEVVHRLFDRKKLRLEYAKDVSTAALSSVLKNIYAVGMGVAEGLEWGWNGKGWFMARSIAEMSDVVSVLGGEARGSSGSVGAGDFIATAMSPHSFNRTTGYTIARTGKCPIQSEGCRSLSLVLQRLGKHAKYFSVLLALDRIVNNHENAKTVYQDLFVAPSSGYPRGPGWSTDCARMCRGSGV